MLIGHGSGHHSHGHHELHGEGSTKLTSALVEVAFHGHHHGHADTVDHSHDVTFGPANLSPRVNSTLQTVTHSAMTSPASLTPVRLAADLGQPPNRATEALFTAHCSLLI